MRHIELPDSTPPLSSEVWAAKKNDVLFELMKMAVQVETVEQHQYPAEL